MREPRLHSSKRLRIIPNPPSPPTLLCARAALLRARTRCKKLPSDFIEKLPAITKIHRDAFEDTPLYEQGIARSLKRKEGYSVDDETGTIATFGEGVETIEIQDEEDKKKVVKVFIGNGAIAIAEEAFKECEVLAVVSVPATLETIGKAAFSE